MTQHQKDIVYQIVKDFTPIRTEQVKIEAMRLGISCPDRYLRYLQTEDRVYGERLKGDKTYTWRIKIPNLPTRVIKYDAEKGIPEIRIPNPYTALEKERLADNSGKPIPPYVKPDTQLTLNFIKANSQALKGFLA